MSRIFRVRINANNWFTLLVITLFLVDFVSKVMFTNNGDTNLSFFFRILGLGAFFLIFGPSNILKRDFYKTLIPLLFLIWLVLLIFLKNENRTGLYWAIKVLTVLLITHIFHYYLPKIDLKRIVNILITLYIINFFIIILGIYFEINVLKMEPLSSYRFGWSGMLPYSGNELIYPLGYSLFLFQTNGRFKNPKDYILIVPIILTLLLVGLKSGILAVLIWLLFVQKPRKIRQFIYYSILPVLISVIVIFKEQILIIYGYWVDMFNKFNLLGFLLSGRNERLGEVTNSLTTITLFKGTFPYWNNVEMDYFNLTLFFGIPIGTLLYVAILKNIIILKNYKNNLGINLFILLTSFFAGHLIESVYSIIPLLLFRESIIRFSSISNV